MSPSETVQHLEAARRGEQPAYRHLFEAYSQGVFATCMRLTGAVEVAEELTQDVFLRAFKALETYDERITTFSTWVQRIAYHLSVSYMRSSKPPPASSLDEESCEAREMPDGDIAKAFNDLSDTRTEQLMLAIEKLPPEEQHLLMLYYFEERSRQEISYISGLSVSALSSRLMRIRKKLYQLITAQNQ